MASLKTIKHYRKHYPFEPPHKVLLDTRFIEFMIRCKKTVKDISHLLGNEAKLFTTRCVKSAIQMVPSILERDSTRRFLYSIPDLKCAHSSEGCMSNEECIACMFENGNRECYFVATTNEALKTKLNKMRAVPVICLKEGNIVLLKPLTDSKAVQFVESSWDKPVDESKIEEVPNKAEILRKLLTSDDEPSTKKEKKPALGRARGRPVRMSVANDKLSCRARKGDSGGAVRWEKAQNMKRDKEVRKSSPLIDDSKSKQETMEAKMESFDVEEWLMGKKRNPGNGEGVGMGKKRKIASKEEKLLLSDKGLSTAFAESMFAAKEPAKHRRGNNPSEGLVQGNGESVGMAKKGKLACKEEKLLLSDKGLSTAAKEPAKHRRGNNASEGLVQGNEEKVVMAKKGTMARKEEKLLLSDKGLSTAAKEPAESMSAAKEPAKHKRGKCK